MVADGKHMAKTICHMLISELMSELAIKNALAITDFELPTKYSSVLLLRHHQL